MTTKTRTVTSLLAYEAMTAWTLPEPSLDRSGRRALISSSGGMEARPNVSVSKTRAGERATAGSRDFLILHPRDLQTFLRDHDT